jgi:hypothetical protein
VKKASGNKLRSGPVKAAGEKNRLRLADLNMRIRGMNIAAAAAGRETREYMARVSQRSAAGLETSSGKTHFPDLQRLDVVRT